MGVLQLEDSGMDVITKMSEGNPGAIGAIMELITKGKEIDPDSADAGFLSLLMLDEMGIRGTDIYVLWNDSCGRDVRKLLILIRARQLGFIDPERLIRAAKDQTRTHVFTEEEIDKLDLMVCAKLENFKQKEASV